MDRRHLPIRNILAAPQLHGRSAPLPCTQYGRARPTARQCASARRSSDERFPATHPPLPPPHLDEMASVCVCWMRTSTHVREGDDSEVRQLAWLAWTRLPCEGRFVVGEGTVAPETAGAPSASLSDGPEERRHSPVDEHRVTASAYDADAHDERHPRVVASLQHARQPADPSFCGT